MIVLAITLMSCVSVMAQSSLEVSGTVVDKSTGDGVIAATMQLLTFPDSSFVKGTTTGTQGEFCFKDVKKGAYLLKITYIGYATRSIKIDLSNQQERKVNLGTITMEPDAILLKGVEVTAHAAKVAVSGDSLVYNAAAVQKLSTYFLGKMRIHMTAAPDEEIIVSKDKVSIVKRWLNS